MNIISLKCSPIFCPKLGEDQKKRSLLKFSPIFFPKLGARQKQRSSPTLFYANYTILATQKGRAMAQWPPLSTPLLHEPIAMHPLNRFRLSLVTFLRLWIRRFTMIISAWWLQTSSKFTWEEVKRQPKNLENRFIQNKSATVTSS